MILSYVLRLLCLSLACFFLVNLALGSITSLAASSAIRMAERMSPRRAAWFLLALRLFPAAAAAFAVTAICVPSYLWLEPDAAGEQIGFACLAAAVLGAAICGSSLMRSLRAVTSSRRYLQQCERAGIHTRRPEVCVVEGTRPFLAMAGIFHPKIVVSSKVVNALPARQLAAALRHERAHGIAHDNLKRLLVLLSPGILPFWDGFAAIERARSRFTEWAADDRAVAGSTRRSLSLAGALVRVARMSSGPQPPILFSPLLADGEDLSARVNRLLRPAVPMERLPRRTPLMVAAGATLVVSATLAAIIFEPAALSSAHQTLEFLVR